MFHSLIEGLALKWIINSYKRAIQTGNFSDEEEQNFRFIVQHLTIARRRIWDAPETTMKDIKATKKTA